MIELKRSDIGFGSVIIDDDGVTRRGPLGSDTIAWDEIRDYRLTIEVKPLSTLATSQIEYLAEIAMLVDVVRGARGESAFKLGIELLGESKQVDFNWRFEDVEAGIGQVLKRIGEPMVEQARAQLAALGHASFGPIQLSRDEVRWGNKVLERDAVESIELFDNSPLEIRLMARDRVLPSGHAPTAEIPNLGGLLRLAHELGYAVKGNGLLEAFRPPMPRATALA